MPIIFLVQYLTFLPGAAIGRILSPRIAVICSAFAMTFGYIILCFSHNYTIVMLAMALFGVGTGLSNLPVLRNGWDYFPTKLGLVNGIVTSGGSIGGSILTVLADFVFVNPKQYNPKGQFYPVEVGQNLEKMLPYLAGMVGIFSLLSIFLIIPYEEDKNLNTSNIDKHNLDKIINDETDDQYYKDVRSNVGSIGPNSSDSLVLAKKDRQKLRMFKNIYLLDLSREKKEGEPSTTSLVCDGFCSKKNGQLSVFCTFILSK